MHLITHKQIQINKPISQVFSYLSNMEHFADWFPGVLSITSANNLEHGIVGKEYTEKVKIPFKGMSKIKLLVKEVSINTKFITEGEFPPLLPRMEILLSEVASGGTEVRWSMYSRNSNLLFRFLLLPFIRKIINGRAAIGIKTLKRNLERKT